MSYVQYATYSMTVIRTVYHFLPSSNSLSSVHLERYLHLVQAVIHLPVTVESHVHSHLGFAVDRVALG
jgi:hypothetical protein